MAAKPTGRGVRSPLTFDLMSAQPNKMFENQREHHNQPIRKLVDRIGGTTGLRNGDPQTW